MRDSEPASFYDLIAPIYDAMPAFADVAWPRLRPAIARLRPSSFLDVGCGTGCLAAKLHGLVPQIGGVDPTAAMLDQARRRGVAGTTWYATFDEAAVDGPWAAAACLHDTINHVAEPAAILGPVAAMLQQGASFWFDTTEAETFALL